MLTESIFGWPGLGQLTIAAISQRDLPLIQGIVLTFALMFALVNLVVDLLYAVVDPARPARVMSMRLPRALRNRRSSRRAHHACHRVCAVLAPLFATHGVEQMDMRNRFAGPSAAHWLGTDNFGRDLWTRMIFGARISLSIALMSVAAAATIGTAVGLSPAISAAGSTWC